jgi:hypothetical protein
MLRGRANCGCPITDENLFHEENCGNPPGQGYEQTPGEENATDHADGSSLSLPVPKIDRNEIRFRLM